ncbi:hypothetical protein JOC36_001524 [Weissella uvarum]|uniref:hypothetical protein n=1 Tax=Weissella uvarum TaxID=1479233 RepID=UPI0019603F65|nr:hypothetical protein [Weissella uvarum]MBM7617931.1 hypothetical protein [Weissella uvarum]MCM0596073.1 hypothetical protein [Weissella uvarum]
MVIASEKILATNTGKVRLSPVHINLLILLSKTDGLNMYQLQKLYKGLVNNESSISRATIYKWAESNLLNSHRINRPIKTVLYSLGSKATSLSSYFNDGYISDMGNYSEHKNLVSAVKFSFFNLLIEITKSQYVVENGGFDLLGYNQFLRSYLYNLNVFQVNSNVDTFIPDITLTFDSSDSAIPFNISKCMDILLQDGSYNSIDEALHSSSESEHIESVAPMRASAINTVVNQLDIEENNPTLERLKLGASSSDDLSDNPEIPSVHLHNKVTELDSIEDSVEPISSDESSELHSHTNNDTEDFGTGLFSRLKHADTEV